MHKIDYRLPQNIQYVRVHPNTDLEHGKLDSNCLYPPQFHLITRNLLRYFTRVGTSSVSHHTVEIQCELTTKRKRL